MATEIQPGVFWWTAYHEGIHMQVSSYFVADAATLIDPMPPDEAPEWFRDRGGVERIVLTNRHHYRASDEVRQQFGCRVLCNEAGLHEFEGGPQVDGFRVGDEVAPGIVAHEMGAICPDDTALHVAAGDGLLMFADGLIHFGGEVMFVPDFLMDDPPTVKRGVLESARRLCELDFDALGFAHGEPIAAGGRQALEGFVARASA